MSEIGLEVKSSSVDSFTNLSGYVNVRVDDSVLGVKFVSLVVGHLSWSESEGSPCVIDPFYLYNAVNVMGSCNRVVILFEGGVLVVLQPSEGSFLAWCKILFAEKVVLCSLFELSCFFS
jgi:hypothetical protein